MSGHRFESKTTVLSCGCGGEGIIWVRPTDLGNGTGTIEAFCGRHCGIHVSRHYYGIEGRTERKIGFRVMRIWNRAMGVKE
jgi:hypothetical protein